MKPASAITSVLFASVFSLSATIASADEHAAAESQMAMEATFITSLESQEFLADDLMGKDVHSTVEEDESIGTIEDLILNEEGEIKGAIVSVGGFLGMGDKNVAIAWDSLELTKEDDEYVIKVNASQDALENAEEFEEE
jgi:sporulation protein YlmC with PRC-barrel domain